MKSYDSLCTYPGLEEKPPPSDSLSDLKDPSLSLLRLSTKLPCPLNFFFSTNTHSYERMNRISPEMRNREKLADI